MKEWSASSWIELPTYRHSLSRCTCQGAHVSWLPYEVVQLVLRWVVGAEMDAASLERAAASCRGLYVVAREPDLWRCMCVK